HFSFSSRSRHTRSKRDWSSDVCSSDLWNTLNLDPPNLRGWFKVSPIQLFHGGYALLHSVNTVPEPGDIICSLVTHLGPMSILDFNHGHILKRSEERRVGKESRSLWRQT